MTMSSRRKRGFQILPEGLVLLRKKMDEQGYDNAKLAEATDLAIETVNRLFRGHQPQRATIQAVARALGLSPTELVNRPLA